MKQYIIFRDIDYHPYVLEQFDDIDEAKQTLEVFQQEHKDNSFYLCKMIE